MLPTPTTRTRLPATVPLQKPRVVAELEAAHASGSGFRRVVPRPQAGLHGGVVLGDAAQPADGQRQGILGHRLAPVHVRAVRDEAHAARLGGRDRLLGAVAPVEVALLQSGEGVQVVRAELEPQQHQALHRTGIPHQARRDGVLRLGPDQLALASFLPAALPVIGRVGPTALELPVHADHGAHAGPVRPRWHHPLTDPAIRPRTK